MPFITFWKNTGSLAGEKHELFLVRFDDEIGQWVRDEENGTNWGIEHPRMDEPMAFYKDPSEYGDIEGIEQTVDVEVSIELGTPELGVIDEEE